MNKTRDVDALTSSTLKHVRERWWNDDFTEFLRETLQPLAGNRILDVGCGGGTAEMHIAHLRISQLQLFGVDLLVDRVREAVAAARAHNVDASFAAADVSRLPFRTGAFDSTFCVAVLQHVRDLAAAVSECARVTRAGGRVVVVEPDNGARYWYSFNGAGTRAFQLATRFFSAIERDGSGDPLVGPKVSETFTRHGLEPTAIRLFPVSVTHVGATPPAMWEARRSVVRRAIERLQDESLRKLGAEYLSALDEYAARAAEAGSSFVEIQSTMLFATVGHKPA